MKKYDPRSKNYNRYLIKMQKAWDRVLAASTKDFVGKKIVTSHEIRQKDRNVRKKIYFEFLRVQEGGLSKIHIYVLTDNKSILHYDEQQFIRPDGFLRNFYIINLAAQIYKKILHQNTS